MELKGKIINCLGDSITQGAGASDPKEKYVEVLKKISKAKKVNNYGIGGTRIAKKTVPSENAVHDQDYVSRFAEMDDNADVILVFGGTNDYGHGDAKMGTFKSRDPYTFYGALHVLCEGLAKKYVGKPIVFLTPLHRTGEDNIDQNGHVLKEYVNAIKEVAAYYSFPVLDLFAVSGMQPAIPEIKETLMPDGLHPSSKGHAILAERIYNFLLAL